VGPALSGFGVGDALADPAITLYSGSTALATNDNWATADAATMTAVGASPYRPAAKYAVIVATLPAGAYTAVVSGVGKSYRHRAGGTLRGAVRSFRRSECL